MAELIPSVDLIGPVPAKKRNEFKTATLLAEYLPPLFRVFHSVHWATQNCDKTFLGEIEKELNTVTALDKDLLDIQRELKIKATFIAAIENADVSAFETPGFIAGNVRSYARYLGMDPDWAFRKFCHEANFTVAHGMSAAASSPSITRPGESWPKVGRTTDLVQAARSWVFLSS